MTTRSSSAEKHQNATDRATAGLVRRMVATVTRKVASWQVKGHTLLDGMPEVRDPESFQGVGFASRPREGASAETIVVFPGASAEQPIIVAARELGAFKAAFPDGIEADSTAIYTSGAWIVIKANGSIEIRAKAGGTVSIGAGGIPAELATKADLAQLKAAIAGAAVVAGDGGAAFKVNIGTALGLAWPHGTTVLKAE